MMTVAITLALLIGLGLALARAFLGPTLFDRILAVNMFGSKTVLLIAFLAYVAGRSDYLDIALVYAMINFIGMVAVMKFFEYGHLGGTGKPVAPPGQESPHVD